MVSCRLWQNCIAFDENRKDAHHWECDFNDDTLAFGAVDKLVSITDVEDVNGFLEINGAASGQSVLVLSQVKIREYQIDVESEDIVAIREYDPNGDPERVDDGIVVGDKPPRPLKTVGRGRRLAETTGSLTTLVVRVKANDREPPAAAALSEDIFFDDVCLKSQYDKCSYGKLKIEEYDGSNTNLPTPNATGVIEIDVEVNAEGNTKEEIQRIVNTKLKEMLGVNDPRNVGIDLVMFCMPPGMGSWLAYAYIGRWDSYYNNDWCQAVSSQMHEVGHSIGLHHSGEYDGTSSQQEYGDQSDMMGYSYRSDDTPEMCFNPAKNYQLGWYNDKVVDIDVETLGFEPVEYKLNGIVDYNSPEANGYIVVKVGDFYIGYNKATDFNKGVREGSNMVLVNEKLGTPQSSTKSKLKAKLRAGDPTVMEISDFVQVKAKYKLLDGKDAVIELSLEGEPIVCEGEYDAELDVTLTTDNYPDEISWMILDSYGKSIFTSEPYNSIGTYTSTVEGLCRGLTYYFVIDDAYGDGICCKWGNGSFKGEYGDLELFSGGEFGERQSIEFVLPLPTDSPTDSPTANPTASPTTAPTPTPTQSPIRLANDRDELLLPSPDCVSDVDLLKTEGATDFPPLDRLSAVEVKSKDTSTVTVALNQVWEDSQDIDYIYYEYKSSPLNAECGKMENVAIGGKSPDFTMTCNVLTPTAVLTICLVDDAGKGFLSSEDDAAVPKCCVKNAPEQAHKVCYKLSVSCKPGCSTEDSQQAVRRLRG